jgi:HAD superfamily hydrolase (TIGR01549 family)
VTASAPAKATAPLLAKGELKAVIFDVDGTLYRQPPLRRAILFRLLRLTLSHPVHGWTTLRVLRAYRQAQEALRESDGDTDVAVAQLAWACARTRVDRGVAAQCVRRWIEEEPLELLSRYVQADAVGVLRECRARGVRIAALSDYPADGKLRALGMDRLFDLVLCAQAADINSFKPNPRGLLVALDRLGVSAEDALYVGDRVDVDAATARAAKVQCAILTTRAKKAAGEDFIRLQSYKQLRDLLWKD